MQDIISSEIPFAKMVGTGNDFILIDNRTDLLRGEVSPFVKRICSRRVSVGADGVLLLEESDAVDLKMRYFNADGGEAQFCGNGARCIALYAFLNGIAGKEMSIESKAGFRKAWVNDKGVTIDMPQPTDIRLDMSLSQGSLKAHSINVGVPHVIIFEEDLDDVDVVEQGRTIREMEQFQPAGTNVNFVQVLHSSALKVRTYERGVEDETYSCGTGVCASAIIAHCVHDVRGPTNVFTQTGETLTVSFHSRGGHITDCMLTGKAKIVFRGILIYD